MTVASLSVLFAFLLVLLVPSSSSAIATIKVAGNLTLPLHVCSPPGDDRLFIVEQGGKIKILEHGVLLSTPFLDISAKVDDSPYGGLLGLAFHPNYASNGYFYVNYTNTSGNTRIVRYRVSSNRNVASPQSELFILSISQPSDIHNGGNLAFGPGDGYLYIAMGDGGPGEDPDGRGQNPGTLLGKILRIDVDGGSPYAIPPDNPFVGVSGYRPEIWARGVRQPWGLSFDAVTHDLWIADVGETEWEEVNFQPASSAGGENYGWSVMEGPDCFDDPDGCNEQGFVLPIHAYGHGSGLCSINGGVVYRGGLITALRGIYFFADYCTSRIWSFRYDDESVTELVERTQELEPAGALDFDFISAIGTDGEGEMYIVDWTPVPGAGEIYKIVRSVSDVEGPAPIPALSVRIAGHNPFQDELKLRIDMAEHGTARFEILDVTGRLLRTEETALQAGSQSWSWDGKDRSGRTVPAGNYLIRISQAEATTALRVQKLAS